ncbi:MAG: GNAT family N-acetyltransferase [Chloroflexi bacterium]|nr:GNAT family N-acetyltransferase [Chloroflexota bacterium]
MFFQPLFKGQLVRLAAPTPDDYTIMAKWWENDEFIRLLDTAAARPLSAQGVDNWETSPSQNFFLFRFRTLADDTLIGFGDLEVMWPNQSAFLAIGIGDTDYWGKGYGSDGLQLLLRYGFNELGLHRIGLNVISNNTRAIRTYEKAGFRYEGAQKEAVYRDGQRLDMVYYGLLRRDWEVHQK